MLLVCKSLVIFMHRHTSTLTHNAPHTDAGILELCREITTLLIATECATSQLCCPLHDLECHAGANVILGGCLAVLDLCCRDKAGFRVSLISPYSGRFPWKWWWRQFWQPAGTITRQKTLDYDHCRKSQTSPDHPGPEPHLQQQSSHGAGLNSRPHKSGFRGLCCYFRVVVFQARRRRSLRTLRQIPQTWDRPSAIAPHPPSSRQLQVKS